MASTLNSKKNVLSLVSAVFILGGLLFGIFIMVIVFGQANTSTNSFFGKATGNVVNETGAYLNSSGYTVNRASVDGFSGLAVIQIYDLDTNSIIPASNYTVNSQTGVVTLVGAS